MHDVISKPLWPTEVTNVVTVAVKHILNLFTRGVARTHTWQTRAAHAHAYSEAGINAFVCVRSCV